MSRSPPANQQISAASGVGRASAERRDTAAADCGRTADDIDDACCDLLALLVMQIGKSATVWLVRSDSLRWRARLQSLQQW